MSAMSSARRARGEEGLHRGVGVERPRDRGGEAVGPPELHAGGQQAAAVTAPAPARLDQQVCDRCHISLQRGLVRSERRLIRLTGCREPDQVRFLRLLHGHQHPVAGRRRLLDRGGPPAVYPGFIEPVQHRTGENAPVGLSPGGELDPRDLGGVIGDRGADKAKRHGGRAYGVKGVCGRQSAGY
jgi:hypothetical protein